MSSPRSIRPACFALLSAALLLSLSAQAAPPFPEFVDPNPNPGNQFGAQVVPLSTGNVVITSPFDDAGGTDAGAVYLFNGATGALISTLRGSQANDNVGRWGVTALSNGNYVVSSPYWNNGSVFYAGAVTWGSGTSGVSGVVSSSNSLVGSKANDQVGNRGVIALNNGNYVARSASWDNGAVLDAGAVTWGSGTTGVTGVVSSTNSLVGSNTLDEVGSSVTALNNGNYVVDCRFWDNGAVTNVGAVTWGSGTSGVSGVISSSNSLVGSMTNDLVGSAVTALTNGNYVVLSPNWGNGAVTNVGAVTWGNGSSGVSGVVSSSNSLVGSTAGDLVGGITGVTALSNGNYVVSSPSWDNGAVTDAGAATWGNGSSGVSGVVSSSNSLVGSTANDNVGLGGVTALTNGHYVVKSRNWDNGAVTDAGAVTWGSGNSGVSGVVSNSNSLVGSTANDQVGLSGVTALSNGNYVVLSPNWDNGAVANAGAVTWGNGTSGVSGVISSSNSLVGSTANDNVGSGSVTALSNGNYVVMSHVWDNGAVANAGAVTWGNGTSGVSGVVTSSNSLVGSTANDNVGGVLALTNGNYVVGSYNWDNGAVANVGAVTWGNGTSGVSGVVSSSNSLVGSTANDNVGLGGVFALTNGNYVVSSYNWGNGAVANVGAVTWGNGTSGVSGVISSSNSLIGSRANDNVGSGNVTALSNGNYVVMSHVWDNGAVANAGSVTWGNGTSGVSGVVSSSNSLVGLVASAGIQAVVADGVNNTFVGRFKDESSGKVRLGSQADGLVPNVLSVTPATGSSAGGNSVTLTGRGLTGATAVTFDGNPATGITAVNYTTLTATVPAHAPGVVNVSVTTPQGTNAANTFYTYAAPPTVTSPTSTAITATGANLGGNVTADGASTITERGVVYSVTTTNNNPLIGGGGVTKVTTAGTMGVFIVPVTDLSSGTGYSFKAYAINSEGTSYTSVATFTTLSTNADLSNLTLSSGTLDPTFAAGTIAYTASVANSTTSITTTPTRAQANATIEARVNSGGFSSVSSGSPSGSLALNVGANTIEIRVTAQAGNTKTYTITVTRDKAVQTITFPAITDKTADATVPLSATGGGSGNAVTFAVTNGPGSINGSNQLTFTGAGSVTITASQLGNANYHDATPVARTFNVTKATATVNLTGLFQSYDGSPRVVGATTAPSGKTVNLTYAGSSSAPIDAGSYAIVATIDDPIYEGVANATLTVSKASQTITFAAITDKLANATVPLSATGGASGNAVTFSVTNGPGSITGNSLTFTGAGSVTITASQAGNTNYSAATPVARTFNVTQASASVTISNTIQPYNGTARSVTVTTSPPGLSHSVVYIGQPGPPTNVGIYGVNVSITDPRYTGSRGADLMIQKADQTITFPTIPDTVETATLALSATGGGSGNAVTFAVTNGPAYLSGPTTLRFHAPGSVTITASQAGNSNYNAATPVARTFLVDDSTAGVTISNLRQVADGNPHPVTVTTDPPGLTVNLTYNGSANPPVAAGRYAVVATVNDALYDGTAQATYVLDDPGVLIRVPGGNLPQRSSLGPLQVETFEIGRYEVTWGFWKTVRDWALLNGYQFDSIAAGCADNHPVRRVMWFDAVKWCNARTEWENATLGRSLAPVYRVAGAVYRSDVPDPATIVADATAGGYRLPTASEWEFAARGGEGGMDTQYPGGSDPLLLAWFRDNSTGAACNLSNGRGTWPVGGKSPNELGIFDFAGNVMEWTWTATPGNLDQRYSLGGSWDGNGSECQIGALGVNGVTYTDIRFGFRVGRSIASALTVALDDAQRTWDSSGAQPWFAQTGTTHDGTDAAESGAVYPGEESRLETTFTGPGNLSFQWKAATNEGADVLELRLGDSSVEGSLTGATEWAAVTLEIPDGEWPVQWLLKRHPQSPAGSSRAWIDQVVYTPVTIPILTTTSASDITTSGATLGGEVTDNGGRAVTDRGIVWSIDPEPTVEEDTVVTGGTGTGAFTVSVSGLTAGTTYHVRAFATNNVGTAYGSDMAFTTRTTAAFTDGVASYTRSLLPGGRQVFSFTLTGPRIVSLSTLGGAALRAELYDSEGNLITSFTGDANFDLEELLLAGDYSLHVFREPDGGQAQNFDLTIDASVVAASRPDVAVGASAGALAGVGLYSPASQLAGLTSKKANAVIGFASVANRGKLPDVIAVSGSGGSALFAVSYSGPEGNITAGLLTGTYRTPEMDQDNAPVSIRATITPNKKKLTKKKGKKTVILKKTHVLSLRVTSTFDPAIEDAAKISVQTK
ncbi:MAG: SUMF1/EgtB/PvdO family nonheme iron enzyme [Verrucomicrobiales bacterium]|nr:SUMF1/EgtB/PvdO family nonheme iron enzyme [Verrucomicrobiales bacterium]